MQGTGNINYSFDKTKFNNYFTLNSLEKLAIVLTIISKSLDVVIFSINEPSILQNQYLVVLVS